MSEHPPESEDLRDVIAAAIWRRVTREDGNWSDQLSVDQEEFLDDADAVLAALVAEGYSRPERLISGRDADATATATDTLARESIFRMIENAGLVVWVEYPGLTEQNCGAVAMRILERIQADRPEPAVLLDAYEYLSSRSEVGSSP